MKFSLSSIFISREIITDGTDNQIRAVLSLKVLRIVRNQSGGFRNERCIRRERCVNHKSLKLLFLFSRAMKEYNLQRQIYFSISVEINDVVTGLGRRFGSLWTASAKQKINLHFFLSFSILAMNKTINRIRSAGRFFLLFAVHSQ